MVARLDNSETLVTDCLTIGLGNPNDLLTDSGLIVQKTRQPSEDKTWELDLT